MTRTELAQLLKSRGQPGDDATVTAAWMKAHPDVPIEDDMPSTAPKPGGGGLDPIALGLRVVPAMLGAEGSVPGAAFAGGGEVLAQIYERFLKGEDFRPAKIASAAAIGAIPVGGAAKNVSAAMQIGKQALKGAGVGAASSAIDAGIGEGRIPELKEVATGAGVGGVLGGATQAAMPMLSKLLAKFKSENPNLITSAVEDTRPFPPAAAPTAAERARGLDYIPAKPVTPASVSPTVEREVLVTPGRPTISKLKFGGQEPVPPRGPISEDNLFEFPSIQKMPEEVRGDILDILKKNQGFEAQRRGVQSFERTEALADRVSIPIEMLKPGTALNAEELAAYKNAVSSIETQRVQLAKKITSGQATDIDKLNLMKLTTEATALVGSYRGAKAEAGRALGILRNAARVMRFGDEAFMEAALKQPGFHENVDEVAKAVMAAGGDPIKQLTLLRQASGTGWDKAQAVYYNSLLSGVKTHLRNIIGNSFNMAANLATPVVAGPLDKLRVAVKGGEREVFTGEFGKQLIGTFAGLKTATKNALFTMKHGFTPETVAEAFAGKFDVRKTELAGGLLTNWPTRLLDAGDQFFRTLAETQELYAGAYAMAMKSGIKNPQQIQKRMADLLAGTGPESLQLYKQSTNFAARAVFQEKPGVITNTLLRLKQVAPPGIKEALTFVMPFVKTPGNIIRQGLEASPAGFLMQATKQGGRAGSQAMGRAVGGSIALLPFAMLAAEGKLSGNGPSDAAERAALYESGWQPNSIKMGDKWVRFQLFQPYSVALAAVANAWDKYRESDRSDEAAEAGFTKALAASGASILNQSFLAGINGFLDAISDPERSGERYLSLMAQGMVPGSGMLRNVTQAMDPVVRNPEGIGEAVKTIIPGLSTEVPARLTRLGDEVRRPGGAIQRGFVVPEVSTEINDPVAQLLAKVGSTPEVPKARLTRNGKPVVISRSQAHTMEEAIGKERRALLETQLTRKSPDKRTVDTLLRRATDDVYDTSYRKLKKGSPFAVEDVAPAHRRRMKKADVDTLYQRYLESQK